MDYQQLITFIMEMIGTIAFAASGAMVAVDRAMDIFGVIVLGVTTAVGGGAVRDVILGIVPPAMFQRPIYTIVATFTSCIVFLILYLKKEFLQGHNRETYDKIMLVTCFCWSFWERLPELAVDYCEILWPEYLRIFW